MCSSTGGVRTGDVGWVEPEGWIHITDRAKEMIKVSGFSVSPAEIEATLHGHPAVADCGVYGVPHATKGEAPKAAIVLAAADAATADDLRGYVADRLAGYKHVEEVRVRRRDPAHRIGEGPAPRAEGHRRVVERRPMSIVAIGTYLPPWGSAADIRTVGLDEDAVTMAVQAGRAALSRRRRRRATTSCSSPAICRCSRAATAPRSSPDLGLPAGTEVVEQVGGATGGARRAARRGAGHPGDRRRRRHVRQRCRGGGGRRR